MNIKYKCLILDHDDTAVDSTSKIHYPAHLEAMKRLRPDFKPVTLDEWFGKNFHPGIMEFLSGELNFNNEELKKEFLIWRSYTENQIPDFFPGFVDVLAEFRGRGGIVTVVSHSDVDIIEKHYREGAGDHEFFPDLIFGWDDDETKRKPNTYPVDCILKQYNLSSGDVLILDDLKPGVLMGKAAGISVAAAGWGHCIPAKCMINIAGLPAVSTRRSLVPGGIGSISANWRCSG